jgi:hypothetical protein
METYFSGRHAGIEEEQKYEEYKILYIEMFVFIQKLFKNIVQIVMFML